MVWVKDDEGQSHYMEMVSDYCLVKTERWEHGYYVAVSDRNDPDEIAVPLKYFYTFQDARSFLTNLVRLLKQDKDHDNTSCYI